MRIVSRKIFLSLPPGTVYCPYTATAIISELKVKESTVNAESNDWLYSQLVDIDYDNSDQLFDLLRKMEANENFSVPNSAEEIQRDGLYERSDRFLVLDAQDIQSVITKLSECLANSDRTDESLSDLGFDETDNIAASRSTRIK